MSGLVRGCPEKYHYIGNSLALYSTARTVLRGVRAGNGARLLDFQSFKLIDVTTISDEELYTHKSAAALELVQKHIRTRDVLQYIQAVLWLVEHYPLSPEKARAMLYYLYHEGECSDHAKLHQLVIEKSPVYGEDSMKIAEQLRQEGRQETMKIAAQTRRPAERQIGSR